MSDNVEIIIGTYEQFLLGYKIESTAKGHKLTRSFATHSHQASVRDVASNKHYLASAGADDSIYLYNMRNRMESGKLTHHNDTVNTVAFTPDSSHILSCSTDGSIAAVRCGNWKLEKHWKSAHKGSPVNSLCIHPSGKLALSLGGDGVLRTWNLVKGRQAYATNLVSKLGLEAKNLTVNKWSPDGTKYLIATNFKVILYSVENAGVIDEFEFKLRVTCVEFANDNVIIIGHDDGQVEFYDLESSSEILLKNVHDTRVKAVACNGDLIATASSSGEVKLWQFTTESLSLLASEHCGARITCMVLAESFAIAEVKKEEVVVNLNDIEIKKKNVFKIRQEVIIEDEDDDENEERTKMPKKSLKKLKQKSKNKSISSADIDESDKSQKNVGKKSKLIAKSVSPKKLKNKLKKAVTTAANQSQRRTSLGNRENNESNRAEASIVSKELKSKKIKKKRKLKETVKEDDIVMDQTMDLASPLTKKKKSLTPLKSVTKVMKRKRTKLKKVLKQ